MVFVSLGLAPMLPTVSTRRRARGVAPREHNLWPTPFAERWRPTGLLVGATVGGR